MEREDTTKNNLYQQIQDWVNIIFFLSFFFYFLFFLFLFFYFYFFKKKGSPLLSRFDLIFILQDNHNKEFDKSVSSFILNREISSENNEVHSQLTGEEKNDEDEDEFGFGNILPPAFSFEKLQNYVSYVQENIFPELNKNAEELLISYYKRQRLTDQHHTQRTTIRFLESLVRLSQAHARLMVLYFFLFFLFFLFFIFYQK